jgi:N-acetylglucosamine-6-sulfatase
MTPSLIRLTRIFSSPQSRSSSLFAASLGLALLASCAGDKAPSDTGGATAPAPAGQPAMADPPKSAGNRPNIVFILVDDLDNNLFARTASLQTLMSDQGTRFENNFASVPLCCPSRVTTLRGQFAHNTHVFTNEAPEGGFARALSEGLEKSTIGTWLQGAGYRTAMIGKYLNGYPKGAPSDSYIPPGWTYWLVPNAGKPYKEYDYTFNDNGKSEAHGNAPQDYMIDVLAAKASAFIRDSAGSGKPFFVYLAPFSPHTPSTPPPRYESLAPQQRAPRTAAFNEADNADKPNWLRSMPLLSDRAIGRIDKQYGKRFASMQAIGDMVKSVIDTLKQTGQLDNTYVFFASDNGFHQGQHRMHSGKNTPYSEDIDVALVVRGPGVPAGRVVSQLTGNVDYAPTFAELAGVPLPSFVDGRSLVALMKGNNPSRWRKAFLIEHGGSGITPEGGSELDEPPDDHDIDLAGGNLDETDTETGGGGRNGRGGRGKGKRGGGKGKGGKGKQARMELQARVYAGVRTESSLSYVEYDTGECELYDLARDPDEMSNNCSRADAAQKKKLSDWVARLKGASGQTLRDAEESSP